MNVLSPDRVIGSLIGGAIGDAVGNALEGREPPFEFLEPEQFSFSDDTQLTMATCEAIIETGRPDPEAIARRFVSWFTSGKVTGLGASTLKALRDLKAGAHWALAGRRGDRAAGNGAAMRSAPLAFCVDPNEPDGRRTIRDVSRITHDNDEAYCGALAVVISIHAAWNGESLPLDVLAERLPDTRVRDQLAWTAKNPEMSLKELAEQRGNSGYVVESVPFAIEAARRSTADNLARLMQELVCTGGDADTNASMFGQMAGARYGLDALPARWTEKVPKEVRSVAERFSEVVTR